ncbi:hypothetical protein GGI43DRAFT_414177 [Trichoderma evansii]
MKVASHLPSLNSSAFLALPLEIRQQIYRFCIPQNLVFDIPSGLYSQPNYDWSDEISDYNDDDLASVTFISSRDGEESGEEETMYSSVDDGRRSALPGLLLCCRQITEEVMDMLYKGNTFRVDIHDDGQFTLADLFSSKTREKIRKVVLNLQTVGFSYNTDLRMDPNIWDSILGNLSVLGVIAEQPGSPAHKALYTTEPEDDHLEEWTAQMASIFGYLRRALHRDATILVDANGEKRTVEAIEEAMPGRCRFQRLVMGDFLFRRGKFSPDSEYWNNTDDCDYRHYYSD